MAVSSPVRPVNRVPTIGIVPDSDKTLPAGNSKYPVCSSRSIRKSSSGKLE